MVAYGLMISINQSVPYDRMTPAGFGRQADEPVIARYERLLRFNVYTFSVKAADSGAVRDLTIKAYRGQLLLTNFRVRVHGTVTGAEVADLDHNRLPELYVFSSKVGSGSFGGVNAWQFMPERKADILAPSWHLSAGAGYMGHDSLWIERDVLCRRVPVYRPGDANAEPSGGHRMIRYHLRSAGANFALVVIPD